MPRQLILRLYLNHIVTTRAQHRPLHSQSKFTLLSDRWGRQHFHPLNSDGLLHVRRHKEVFIGGCIGAMSRAHHRRRRERRLLDHFELLAAFDLAGFAGIVGVVLAMLVVH